jgi:hypothetical protein
MSELHLTHIALVGARMSAFKQYGFHDRNQLAMRRITPYSGGRPLEDIPGAELPDVLRAELPIWIHNMIADPDFPGRNTLLMSLRRFEGELCDSKNDEVVALVLSAGFKNQTLDPLNLPSVMPLRQRCAIVMHIKVWQEAYRKLEEDLILILSAQVADICRWVDYSRDTRHAAIE